MYLYVYNEYHTIYPLFIIIQMVAVPVNYQAVSGGVHITPKHIKLNPALPVRITSYPVIIVSHLSL